MCTSGASQHVDAIAVSAQQSILAEITNLLARVAYPPLSTLSYPAPAILLADHAAPSRKALGRMLLHPLGELRRSHQARLHRDVSEVRDGDGLLAAICR